MAQLKVVITDNLVEDFVLSRPLVIGRAAAADVTLLDAAVSRAHARVEPRDAAWWCVDLRSANGTFVNDVRLSEPHRLVEGDVIRIGSKVLVFTLDTMAAAPRVTLDWRAHGAPAGAAFAEAVAAKDVCLVLPSDDTILDAVVPVLLDLVAGGPLTTGEAEALGAAAREAIGNAIAHGNAGVPDRSVTVRVIVDADRVRCAVTDEGAGFDFGEALQAGRTRHAMDLARERYEQGGMGGLGIMLMLRSVDLVEYTAPGNRLVLTKWRGDFFRDETIYGSLGLFAQDESGVRPALPIEPAPPPLGPRHPTVRFDSLEALDGDTPPQDEGSGT